MANIDKAEKISITLPPEMLASIREKVKAGIYSSTSEVIREAMRLWQREEEEHQARLALIRERLERSANSGKPERKQRVRPAYLHICVYIRLEAFQIQHQRFEGESNPRTPVV